MNERHELKIFVLGGLLLVGVTFFFLNGMVKSTEASLQPKVQTPSGYKEEMDFLKNPEKTDAYLQKLAARTEGRADRLTQDELTWLDGLSRGHAADVIAQRYKRIQGAAKAGKAASPSLP